MKPKLKRTLSLPQMVLYGLGTTIGAGIYALIGALAETSGYLAPIAFLVAALLAALTAFSFAELAGRFPRAAGAALYVQQGFGSPRFATLVGLMVITAGLVSASALVNAFIGYLDQLIPVQRELTIFLTVAAIGLLAAWGIAESVFVAALITLIEVSGLVWMILISHPGLENLPQLTPELIPSWDFNSVYLVYSGVLLAFFAFIGFEDMVDVAEEVKNVTHTLPMAILLTLAITTVLYITIMIMALLSMPPEQLARSDAPLAALYEFHTGQSPTLISLIGLFAIINGALIQVIMASRVLYGLSCRQQLPGVFKIVHPKTHTPLNATLVAALIVLTLALIGNLTTLAEANSLIMLSVFSLVNLALWRIKKHRPEAYSHFHVPRVLPLLGFVVSFGFVMLQIYGMLAG